MGKIAKIVILTFTTRVIVDELDSEDVIITVAAKSVESKINSGDLRDSVEDIFDDKEQPYDHGKDFKF